MSNFYAVIMAGGYGERFWPLSTKDKPKQFINLINDQSLIEMTVERISPIFSNSNIVIITNNEHLELTKKTFPNIPEENIIGEPLLRDTGAAITTSLAFIKNLNPNATFCVLASDHFIDDKKNFNNTILNSMSLAAEDDILITIGIKPTFPSTGYGYIKKETLYKTVKDLKFYITKRFVEKPNIESAKYYVSDKDYYWNSGIFIWSVNSLEKALEHSTSLFNYYNKLLPYVEKNKINQGLKELYPDLEKISIDYALMEKVNNIVVVDGVFDWSDVGTWDSLETIFDKDENKNTFIGKISSHNSKRNIVYSKDKLVALLGVNDLIIVETDDGILICKKGYEQDIKKIKT